MFTSTVFFANDKTNQATQGGMNSKSVHIPYRVHIPGHNSISKLRQAVLAAWEAIPIESINCQVRLMLKRVERCLVARGGHTSF
jgi:hypothetical protein